MINLSFRNIVELPGIDAPVHFAPADELDHEDFVFFRSTGNTILQIKRMVYQ